MSLLSDFFYADGFYGADELNRPPGGPADLVAYQNDNINNVVLYWTLDPCTEYINDFVWTVEVDKVKTFDSPDKATYVTSDPGVEFIQGKVHKGIVVPAFERLQGEENPMYWRVKGENGGSETVFVSSVFMTPMAIDGVTRDAMLDRMPDPIYKKTSDSNNYKMHWSYGQALDDHFVRDIFANNDISSAKVRDITVQSKFGDYVAIKRPQAMKAIDFREIVRVFMAEARESSRIRAIINVAKSALGVAPNIENIRDTVDTYVMETDAEEDGFYLPDEGAYQTITFSPAVYPWPYPLPPVPQRPQLVYGNIYNATVSAVTIQVPFRIDSDTTMQDIADQISTHPLVEFAKVIKVAAENDDDRVIVIKAADPLNPPVITGSQVLYGESQAVAAVANAGSVPASTIWNNTHLSGGVIVEVSNPAGAIVSRDFLQGILRKLSLANSPLFVTGID